MAEQAREGRVDGQAGPPGSVRPHVVPPVADTLTEAGKIADGRRADSGVFDKEHAVSLAGEPRHDLLMPLPVEVPVDRGQTHDGLAGQRRDLPALLHGAP